MMSLVTRSFFFALCYQASELPALLTSSIPSLSHLCPFVCVSLVSTTIRVLRVPHTPRAHAARTIQRVLRLFNSIILTYIYLYY